MKNKLIVFLTLVTSVLSSCNKFDTINTDTNSSTTVPASMIATYLLTSTLKDGGDKYFCYHNMISKHMAWMESQDDYQYNYIGASENFDIYQTLRNCEKMVEAANESDVVAYEALSLFLKAYNLFYLSLDLGDIPYSEALSTSSEIYLPKYDTQKEVMLAILSDLDSANDKFATAPSFDGDIIYGGDPKLWQKCVNSFQLKVLINLSKRVDDADLNIKGRFAEVMQRPIISSNDENYQLVYSNTGGQLYPFNNSNCRHTAYAIISSTMIDPFKKLNDYRLFAIAEPAMYQTNLGVSEYSYDAYMGVDPSLQFDKITSLVTENKYCALNKRYSDYAPGEPVIRVGYAEINYIIAEAINLSIIDGDVEHYYNTGIRAALEFVANNTPSEYNHGREITPDYIDSYITSSEVVLSTDKTKQKEQINLQRYLTRLLQNKWDAYYDYRRTGLPELPIDPESNKNEGNPNGLPTRWRYPTSEYKDNGDNLKVALDRQYGGSDENNDLMWILK